MGYSEVYEKHPIWLYQIFPNFGNYPKRVGQVCKLVLRIAKGVNWHLVPVLLLNIL